MEKKQIEEAIALFERQYGAKPENTDFRVIDIYKKQRAYLYGTSQEVINAYKASQNIARWIIVYYFWPIIVDVILLFICMLKYEANIDNLASQILIGFGAAWVVLFWVLWYIVIQSEKKIRGNVVWLNYV